MDCKTSSGGRSNWLPMLLCAILILSSTQNAYAGLLNWRQESDAQNAASAAIKAAEETTTPEATGPSTIVASTGPAAAAITRTSNATSSNNTASATSAAAASETQFSSPLNSTNDPNMLAFGQNRLSVAE